MRMRNEIENSRGWWKQNLMKALTMEKKLLFSPSCELLQESFPYNFRSFFFSYFLHFYADYRRFFFQYLFQQIFFFLPVANKRAPDSRMIFFSSSSSRVYFFSFFDTIFLFPRSSIFYLYNFFMWVCEWMEQNKNSEDKFFFHCLQFVC